MRYYSLLGLLYWAQTTLAFDASPVDAKAMLLNLKQIQQKHDAAANVRYGNDIRDFFNAAANGANAMAFYEQAIQATQFAGQNREHSQFQDWKKKEADRLKSREMQEAVRLQLNYLGISLQRVAGLEVKALLPALINHADQVLAEENLIYDQDFMKQSIANSIFAKWYQINGAIGALKDWELTAGDAEGIYQKIILPVWRDQKDPRLLRYWDARLDRESAQAGNAKAAFQSNTFEQIKKPKLLWARAQDMLLIGDRNRALTEMFAIIKNYPTHPSFDQWSSALESWLTGAKTVEGEPPSVE